MAEFSQNALLYLAAALRLAPLIIQAGQDIVAFAMQVLAVLSKQGDPTPEEWDALTTKEAELRAVLQAPLE
jgi:hypothetical protein